MSLRFWLIAPIVLTIAIFPACTPDQALDFGPLGEISDPPIDALSAQIVRDFDGRDFEIGHNDKEAEVRLSDWAPGRRVVMPFWLGVNPIYPGLMRPKLGYLYVISESIVVRPLADAQYLIRAGSMLFKSDTLLKTTHTRYIEPGKMLPTVVRFVGTAIITVPRDAPATGTITIKVPVLREVSLPMHIDRSPPGYAQFEVEGRVGRAEP